MTAYLIANKSKHAKFRDVDVSGITLSSSDVVARMNTATTRNVFNRRTDILFANSSPKQFLTNRRTLAMSKDAAIYFFISKRISLSLITPRVRERYQDYQVHERTEKMTFHTDYPYFTHMASCGCLSAIALRALGFKRIVLVGFTHEGIRKHDWDNERTLLDSFCEKVN